MHEGSGTPDQKAAAALAAGINAVLYCNGSLEEWQQAARGLRPLTPEAYARYKSGIGALSVSLMEVNKKKCLFLHVWKKCVLIRGYR